MHLSSISDLVKRRRMESISKRICLNHNSYAVEKVKILCEFLFQLQIAEVLILTLMRNNEQMLIMHGCLHLFTDESLSSQDFIELKIFSVQKAVTYFRHVTAELGHVDAGKREENETIL